ncbi:MAG: hypothetical protein WCT52_05900 [Candidatus Micrarchaeia archaeon]
MNRYAVLASEYEHLSYPLGRNASSHGLVFSERRENFVLHRAESSEHAKMVVGAGEGLSEHCSLPVGYVASEDGEVFLVSRLSGKQPDASVLTSEEKSSFSVSVMRRLAALHSQGFGCGGISPEAVVYSGKEAKLSNPSAVFALDDSDSLFYEAVATMRALAGKGYAKQSELPKLASAYLSSSPICRHGVAAHMAKRKVNRHYHARELAAHAGRLLAYF